MNVVRSLLMFVVLGLTGNGFALADISGGGGIWVQGGSGHASGGGAILLSTGESVPVVPTRIDVSGLIPLAKGGGYALTVEARTALSRGYVGGGVGVGQFNGTPAGGVVTAFVGKQVAPFTSLELRGYEQFRGAGATGMFAGVRFSF